MLGACARSQNLFMTFGEPGKVIEKASDGLPVECQAPKG